LTLPHICAQVTVVTRLQPYQKCVTLTLFTQYNVAQTLAPAATLSAGAAFRERIVS
jgi:hypothetical protein